MHIPEDILQEFLSKTNELHLRNELVKLTLSKPRIKKKDLRNIYIRPVIIKNQLLYSCTFHYATKDEVKNLKFENLHTFYLAKWLLNDFLNADLVGTTSEIQFIQSIKGKNRLTQKEKSVAAPARLEHNREKIRLVPSERPFLQLLGICDLNGRVFDKTQDKYRQINKYIEIVAGLLKNQEKKELTIADMGSGKGYLSFALYDWLIRQGNDVIMEGYEIRKDLVEKCNQISEELGFENLSFVEQDISKVNIGKKNIVIALHACDIATDMAIAKGIESEADLIIVAPCCHKQIRKSMKTQNLLSPILEHGILEERQAEIITDGIRALLMEAAGYRTKVFEFISSEHTAKNLMITGIKGKPDLSAIDHIKEIKSFFGIPYHYLEKLIKI